MLNEIKLCPRLSRDRRISVFKVSDLVRRNSGYTAAGADQRHGLSD